WMRAAARNRLESLPPFWVAYGLTAVAPIGTGILALPIALAVIGPIPALLLLLLVGVVNIVTAVWIAEAAARTADIRYGGYYFGRMVKDYLGKAGAALLTSALVIYSVIALIAYAVGLAGTLSSAQGMTGAIWVAVLFGL